MSDTITLRPDELEMIEIYRQHGDVELLARFLHQQSCIRRGMFNPWNGGHTNRAYWRRRAAFAALNTSAEPVKKSGET